MGDEKSSDAILPIRLSVEIQLAEGQVVQLSGSEFGDEVWPFLDSHLVYPQGPSDGGLGFEVPNGVSFEHSGSISVLYPEHNTALQSSSYAEEVETMGARIKMLRNSKGWTQQQLGERVGVSKVAVYQWEVGKTDQIKLRTFLKLVEELGTNTHYLLLGPDAPRTQPRKKSQI